MEGSNPRFHRHKLHTKSIVILSLCPWTRHFTHFACVHECEEWSWLMQPRFCRSTSRATVATHVATLTTHYGVNEKSSFLVLGAMCILCQVKIPIKIKLPSLNRYRANASCCSLKQFFQIIYLNLHYKSTQQLTCCNSMSVLCHEKMLKHSSYFYLAWLNSASGNKGSYKAILTIAFRALASKNVTWMQSTGLNKTLTLYLYPQTKSFSIFSW